MREAEPADEVIVVIVIGISPGMVTELRRMSRSLVRSFNQ
jgi:hypothetical protein